MSEIIVKTGKFCFRNVNRTGIIVEGTVHQFGETGASKYRTSQFVTYHEFHNQCYLKTILNVKFWWVHRIFFKFNLSTVYRSLQEE